MYQTQINQEVYGSFDTVEVNKEKLLDILRENRERHNLIYNASLSGYYEKVEEWRGEVCDYAAIQSKKYSEVAEQIKDFSRKGLKLKLESEYGKPIKPFDYIKIDVSIKKKYPAYPEFPTSYEDSYNQAIKKLELSVHDKFKLSENEFQKYVMNNWEWKTNFVNMSYNYLNNTHCYTGYFPLGSGMSTFGSVSGCLVNF